MTYLPLIQMPGTDISFLGWLLIPFSMLYILYYVVKGYIKGK